MYRILKGEIIKKGLTLKELAGLIGISEKTLRNKINGETEFTWPEVCNVHRLVNPRLSKEELFQQEERERTFDMLIVSLLRNGVNEKDETEESVKEIKI